MPELVCAADSPDWLAERRKGVTATDITAITGLSPYESEYSLYWKKLGQIPDDHADNDRLRLGRELEPIIVARWLDTNNVPPKHRVGAKSFLYRSSERPWQLATPDRVFYDEPLEVKSWADADRDRWTDQPPARVRAQVLWQMDTLDVATGHVGVLFIPSGEFRSYVIEHDHQGWRDETTGLMSGIGNLACETCKDIDLLRSAGRDFMDRLDRNDPPSPDASSATLAALKARFADPVPGKEAEIDAGLWNDWEGWKAREDEAERERKGFEALIREQAGEAKYLTVGGVKVATRVVGDAPVKAHTRHMDYIRRIPAKGDTDE